MPYYRTCPLCGAALDPGEICDCQDKEKAAPVQQHQDGQKVDHELSDLRRISSMADFENEIIQLCRNAKDPTAAMETVFDMITRLHNGESVDSIASSYGLVRNKAGHFDKGAVFMCVADS